VRRALCIPLALIALAMAPAAATAAPPVVLGSWPSDVGTESVTLRAEIDPGGLATTYLFEYTTEADFRTKGFIGATKQPQLSVSIGKGLVFQRVRGLVPDTAYRFRAVAINSLDTKTGALRSFKTDEPAPVFALPDNRGWEMVSPAAKNGGEIQGFGQNRGGGVIQAAAQGSAVTYTSASSFADAEGSPGPNQYVSTRADGPQWATDNVTLPMLSGTYPEAPDSGVPYQLFSTDLSGGVVSNGRRCRTSVTTQCPVENAPLAGSGAPAGYRNYYLRNNSNGSFGALLSTADIASLPLGPEDFEVAFAGATSGLEHVILSSCAALTPDASEVPGTEGECDPAKQNLYEKTGTSLKLISLLPGQGTGTPGAALAAQSRAVSADGSRVYFTVGGNLYLREGTLTKQPDEAQGGGGTFETASTDGSVAFFSKEGHLYRYSAASGTATELALSPPAGLQGVLGASDDGTFLYYLTAAGLYLNRNGAVTQVAPGASPLSTPPVSGNARVSADGRRLLFVSGAELTPYDNRNIASGVPEPEVYLFTATGTAGSGILCASCNPSGERPTGPASLPGASPNGSGPNAPHAYKPRVLSEGSKRVFFDTFDALAIQDTNRDRDVYQWEAPGQGNCTRPAGCTGLISSGRAEGGASFLDASASGDDAFFLTDGSLVASDPAGRDVYDARVGGGSADAGPAIPCFGDACQALPPEPLDPATGTRRSKPSGNLAPLSTKALHCKKGEVKKRGKCVKRKTRHKKRGGGK
jgi:hypothetical protein